MNLGGDEVNDLFNFGGSNSVLEKGTLSPRQFSISFDFKHNDDDRIPGGRLECSYGQTAVGSVAIYKMTLSAGERRFRAVRRDKDTYSMVRWKAWWCDKKIATGFWPVASWCAPGFTQAIDTHWRSRRIE